MVKAQLVFDHVQRGNLLLLENPRAQAAAEFRPPSISMRKTSSRRNDLRKPPEIWRRAPRTVACRAWQIPAKSTSNPEMDRATFHYSGDVRGLFAELSAAYGVTAQFDDSVQARQVRFNVDDVDFFTALKLACEVSKTMWAALDAHQLLIAADNSGEPQAIRPHVAADLHPASAFHAAGSDRPGHHDAQHARLALRHFRTDRGHGGSARPQPILEACSKLLEQLGNQRPQVMLDVRVYQISHQLTRNIGVHIPNTFNMYNIPAAALAGLRPAAEYSATHQPVDRIGWHQPGGQFGSLRAFGSTGRTAEFHFQPAAGHVRRWAHVHGTEPRPACRGSFLNESWVRSLENMNMRASQGNDATFHLGESIRF